MSRRDVSPKRGPTPPQESQCSRSLHTPLYHEWLVHKPCGSIVDKKDAQLSGCGEIISKYASAKLSWLKSFSYVPESTAGSENCYTHKQALELAERHRDHMNTKHCCAVALWRYVRPQHVEVKFFKCAEGTVLMERNYWERIRHTASFSYTAKLKKFFMRYRDPLSGETYNTSLSAFHVGVKAPLKLHYFDGDRLHLCLPNLRVRETPVAQQKRPPMQPRVTAELVHDPDSQCAHYRIHAVRYYPIANDAPVDCLPQNLCSAKYCQHVDVVRESGFLFWMQTYTKHMGSHFQPDAAALEAMRKSAEQKVNAIQNYWGLSQ